MSEVKKQTTPQPTEVKVNMTTDNSVFVLRPKTSSFKMFQYLGFENLKHLIAFVGVAPQIQISTTGKPELLFKKQVVKEGDFISVNSFGEIMGTYSQDEVSDKFEIVASRQFSTEDINKVVEKQRKPRETKDKK